MKLLIFKRIPYLSAIMCLWPLVFLTIVIYFTNKMFPKKAIGCSMLLIPQGFISVCRKLCTASDCKNVHKTWLQEPLSWLPLFFLYKSNMLVSSQSPDRLILDCVHVWSPRLSRQQAITDVILPFLEENWNKKFWFKIPSFLIKSVAFRILDILSCRNFTYKNYWVQGYPRNEADSSPWYEEDFALAEYSFLLRSPVCCWVVATESSLKISRSSLGMFWHLSIWLPLSGSRNIDVFTLRD